MLWMFAPEEVLFVWCEHNMNDDGLRWVAQTLERLAQSAFRAKFTLGEHDRAYARAKGREVIDRHARELLRSRVGAAEPEHDGRQTPWRGHPVFTAQHATATCCRGCIEKWHHIPKGRELTDDEVDRLADLVMAWIDRDLAAHPGAGERCEPTSSDSRSGVSVGTKTDTTVVSHSPDRPAPSQPSLF